MTDPFANSSLARHLVRGVVGFGALAGSLLLIPAVGLVSLLLAPLGLVAFRGCPTRWAIGLIQTISNGRVQRSCVDGRCELIVRSVPSKTRRPQPITDDVRRS
jgi:hypothetical protein